MSGPPLIISCLVIYPIAMVCLVTHVTFASLCVGSTQSVLVLITLVTPFSLVTQVIRVTLVSPATLISLTRQPSQSSHNFSP